MKTPHAVWLLWFTGSIIPTCLLAAPPNDNFGQADLGSPASISVEGTTARASRQVGEPAHAGNSSSGSVWWSWGAPADGDVMVSIRDPEFYDQLALYSGTALDALTAEASDSFDAVVRAPCVGGQQFQIAVAPLTANSGGQFTMDIDYLPRLGGNDAFADRIDLGSESDILVIGNTTGASKELTEPDHGGSASLDKTVWFEWTAPESNLVEMDTSGFSNVLAVYTGDTLEALESVTFGVGEPIFLNARAATRYMIAAASQSGSEFDLSINRVAASPANDDFADALQLTDPSPVKVDGTILGTTREPGEPGHGSGNSRIGSSWFSWTAAADGFVSLLVTPDDVRSIANLAVYTGSALEALTLIDSGQGRQILRFSATQGLTYSIAVAGSPGGIASPFSLELTTHPNHPNDSFADASDLGQVISVQLAGDNFYSSREEGEPQHHSETLQGGSIWYRWTAPADLHVRIATRPSGWGSGEHLAVYTGDEIDSLDPVVSDTSFAVVDFEAEAGITYHIALASRAPGYPGAFSLDLLASSPHSNDAFAAAEALALGSNPITAADAHWSLEPDEPIVAPARGSAWFRWTAPANSGVTAMIVDGEAEQRLSVFRGDTLESLSPLGAGTLIGFAATAGETYYLAVSSSTSIYPEDFSIELESHPLPANDSFAGRPLATIATPGEVSGYNMGAGSELGEPPHDGRPAEASLWWEWIAPSSGTFDFDSSASDHPTRIAIYSGNTLPDLVERAVAGGRVFLDVVEGERFQIAIDTVDAEELGRVVLAIREAPPEANNDDLGDRVPLAGSHIEIRGSNLGATVEPEEESEGVLPPGAAHSVWWAWRASFGTPMTIDAGGSDFPFHLRVFTSPPTDPEFRRMQSVSLIGGDTIRYPVVGQVYYIAISGRYDGAMGNVQLILDQDAPGQPPNDAFASAMELGSPSSLSRSFQLDSPSVEIDEPRHGGVLAGSAWFTWTAPESGRYELDTNTSPTSHLYLGIYQGDSLAELTQVGIGFRRATFSATAGEDYFFAFGQRLSSSSFPPSGGEVLVGFSLDRVRDSAPPSNDQFASPISLSPQLPTSAPGDVSNGSREASEPDHAGITATRSTWWEWTAPESTLVVARADSGFSVAVYTGDALGSLDSISSGTNEAHFESIAGTIYRIAVDHSSSSASQFDLVIAAPPANDDLSGSELLDGGQIRTRISTILTGVQPGEPVHNGDTNQGGSGWWHWVAEATGAVELIASSADFRNFNLAVYIGSEIANLTAIGSAANSLRFLATAGQLYRIAISGTSPDSQGRVDLGLEALDSRPRNDDFADSIELPAGEPATVRGNDFGATIQTGEPLHSQYSSSRPQASVWWHWTATEHGLVVVDTDAESHSSGPYFCVYQGASLGALSEISCGTGDQYFEAVSGETYRIAVTDSFGISGEFFLKLRPLRFNDDFADRIDLGSESSATASGGVLGATVEDGEPNESAGSIWWSWTSPVDQYVRISADSSSYTSSSLAVFTGDELATLVELASHSVRDPQLTFRASAGVTYQISYSRLTSSDTGGVEIDLATFPLIENDDFANRVDLGNTSTVTIDTHNFGATAEPWEPEHAGRSAATSIWFEWTAPQSGVFGIDSSASSLSNPSVAIYQGANLSSLLPTAASSLDDTYFVASAGSRYQIAIDGGAGEFGPLRVDLSPAPAAAENDDFENASPIIEGEQVDSNDIFATTEPGEPHHRGYGDQRSSVWWRWTATGTKNMVINSPSGTVLSLFTGAGLGDLEEVNPTKLADYDPDSLLQFRAQAGVTYWIAVSRRPASSSGEFSLQLTADLSMPNDHFADATDLGASETIDLSGDLDGASAEQGEPFHNGEPPLRSIWYRWEAPMTATFALEISTSAAHRIAVYTGSTISSLAEITSGERTLRLQAFAGTVYHIALDSGRTVPYDFRLAIHVAPALQGNDDFSQRIDLGAGANVEATGSTVGATRQFGETSHGGDTSQSGSVWWSWTAPEDMPVEIDASASQFRNNIGVYTGGNLLTLSEIVSENTREVAYFRAIAGETYQIALSGTSETSVGNVALKLGASGPQSYEEWASSMFPAGSDDALRGADPDSDGLLNSDEYAFAQDPLSPGDGASLLQLTLSASGRLYVSYNRPRSATDLAYVYQFSNDLGTWFPTVAFESVTIEDSSVERVSALIPIGLQRKPKVFVRVVVRSSSPQQP